MINQQPWLDKYIGDLHGKSFVITGSSSGVGLETAKSLAYKGAKIYFAVRNENKTLGVIENLKKEIGNFEYELLIYDQSKLSSIKELSEKLPNAVIDAIVLNAAIYFPKKGSVSDDGTGLSFATNTIGTHLLFECFRNKYPHARFVFVNSIANVRPKNGDFSLFIKQNPLSRQKEYAISKRGVMNLFGDAYLNDKDLFVTMTHPGISATNIIGNGYTPFIKKLGQAFLYAVVHKPWKACLGEVYLAAAEDAKRGDYVVPRGLFHISGYPKKVKIPKRRTFKDAKALKNLLKSNY